MCVLWCSDPSWIAQQSTAYIGWVNSYLSELDESVTSLSADLADGLRLVHLVELLEERQKIKQADADSGAALTSERFSPFGAYNKAPKLKFHKIENTEMVTHEICTCMMKRERIAQTNITSDLIAHHC